MFGGFEILLILLALVIFIIPAIFFLLSLQKCLKRISGQNREMSPGLVWLNLIPIFSLGWMIYTVLKISKSVKNEGKSRNTTELGDGAYGVGLAMCICYIISVIIGFIGIVALILWIIYWVKIAAINGKLETIGAVEAESYNYCRNCGAKVPESATFCTQCGNSMD